MRFEFLKQHRNEYGPIKKACKILKISSSGYYEYLHRRKSKSQIEREALEGFVKEILDRHRGRYGYRRINKELRKTGITVSNKRVLHTMQKLNLVAKGATKKHKQHKAIAPGGPRTNIVERVFTVSEKNRLWVGDITYIPTQEGWLYLATVIDAFSRRVIGWSMSNRITEKIAIDAIEQAIGRENPPDDGSLVFHDDQGVQYTSRAYQKCLESHGIVQSVSRPGTPLDNAVAESFFKTLKRELVNEKRYKTRDEARQDIFKYIELYYNRVCLHSTLGYVSPAVYEHEYA